MAKKIQDADDQLLTSLFHTEPIADDGFSDRIVRRLRRRLWVRRLSMPIAVLIGGLVAFKPAAALVAVLYKMLLQLPQEMLATLNQWVPQPHLIVSGILLLAVAMLGLQMLEDT